MKKLILSLLSVAVFFIGLGAIVERTGAAFRSDEKALELVRKARLALGGDAALANVQSLRIVGQTTRNITVNGVEKSEQGETEIAMQFPDKLMKMTKIGHGDGIGEAIVAKQFDVVVSGDGERRIKIDTPADGKAVKKIVIKKDDGTVQEFTGAEADKFIAAEGGRPGENVRRIIIKKPDGSVQELNGVEADKLIVAEGAASGDGPKRVFVNKISEHGAMRQNEMLRMTLGLLLTAPQGMDVSYTFGGESSVDGQACNIVVAEFGGSAFKIFLGQTSNLPVMMTYKGLPRPQVVSFRSKEGKAPADAKDNVMFIRKAEAPSHELVEMSVKFADFRSTGGVSLPYKWTQTIGDKVAEVFDVTSYEINPANIAEKFKADRPMVRVPRVEGQK